MPSHKSEVAKLLSLGGAAAVIGGAYKFGEFLHKAKRLRDVGPSNAVYVRLINRVRLDLDEVRRLLAVREVHDALEANPEKAKWVYGAMRDVRGALENITPHTERVAGDIEEGRRIGLRHRVYWLISEKEKLENREKEVMTAHASLTEVIGYLTALEPNEPTREKHRHEHVDKKVEIDIDVNRGGSERVDREVWVEHDHRNPKRVVEERETWVEHERRGPRRVEEQYIEHERREPGRYEERETWVDERGPRRYDEREVYVERSRDSRDDRYHDGPGRHIEERDSYVERDPRHAEARYYERGPDRYEERRYDERRYSEPLGRRPESFEDREPEHDTWMQSEVRRPPPPGRYGPYGEYAEYGAPQPIGAANYRLPPNREFEREVWIEEREDFRYDKYGNRLPDRFFPNMYPRSRM